MARRPFENMPTRRQVDHRVFMLVALVAAIQILLDAFAPHLQASVIFGLRLAAAVFVGAGSFAIERHKARRGR